MARSLGPADLDPTEAAATPVTPDPTLRGKAFYDRPGVTASDRRHAALVAAGMSPEQAAAYMAREAIPAGLTDDGVAALEAQRYADETARQEKAYEAERDSYDANGRLRVGPRRVPAPPVDPMDAPMSSDELRAMGLFGQREPGVRGIDGAPVSTGAPLTTRREAEGYTHRAPISDTEREFSRRGLIRPMDPSAGYRPSQRDVDMNARGFDEVYNPDGTVAYSVAAPVDTVGFGNPALRGAPGRRGRRYDLEGQMVDERGVPVQDADGNPVNNYDIRQVPSPTGNKYVYSPSDQALRRQKAYDQERRLYRMAAAANMPVAEFRKQNPELFDDLEMGGVRSGVGARMAVEEGRRKQQQDIRDHLRAVGRLTGGRPSWGPGGSGTAANAFLELPQEWRNAVMAQNLAPRLDGTTPLTAEAQSAKNALRLFNAELLSQGANSPAMSEKMKQGQRDSAQAYFDKYYADNHAGRWAATYTHSDRSRMVTYLRNQYGLSQSEAEAIADSKGSSSSAPPPPPPPPPGVDPAAGVGAAIL